MSFKNIIMWTLGYLNLKNVKVPSIFPPKNVKHFEDSQVLAVPKLMNHTPTRTQVL
jgi:hypothetical protein